MVDRSRVDTFFRGAESFAAHAVASHEESRQELIMDALEAGADVRLTFSPIRREVSVELQHANGKADVLLKQRSDLDEE
jgi:hypothetical protein